MARIKSFAFGTISGRLGDTVSAVMKDGTNIIKVYRQASNPNTEKQQAQRLKFGLINKEIKYMRELFKITFGSTSGVNRVVSVAMRNAVKGTFPDFTFDYSELIVAEGSVTPVEQLKAVRLSPSSLELTWVDTSEFIGISPLDKICIVLANPTKQEALLKKEVSTRNAGRCEVVYPPEWDGDAIHCWIYLVSGPSHKTSKSQYVSLDTSL
ncbi:DUF6266 family protein [Microbacter margulisiae]|uniref:Uncharacterized protein n=1 Tax=Microbacter margulisiae TaxID=1350067 RepID=A0A7W5DU80_9PORP|nr:DUF6266 family protein [Microbacter margulisiae]MBB3188664.1 hypothetical protein [Microbacter margulisiae]